MAGQYETYRKEITNFLSTCTIKFSPLSYVYGASLIRAKGYTDINDTWNPYYQNLCGNYQSYDTMMYVFSREDNTQVPFTLDLKKTHPVLANYYRVPNSEYTELCNKYPTQVGLIKSIVYPAKDIDTVIAAPELSLLNYDLNVLYEGEQQSLLMALSGYLTYVRDRWWFPDLAYEDRYIPAFWYMLWQSLPVFLLSQRIKNVGTPFVHPFHIWEYLISKGLGDYRDVLTIKQSLWLYRNLRWLLKNKGKETALTELAKNILGAVSVSLYGKEILQQIKERSEECISVPEVLSLDLSTSNLQADNSTISQFALRLYQGGLEKDISSENLTTQTLDYGRTVNSQLPTKFLEFMRNNINSRWERLLLNFLVETVLYRYSLGQLKYAVSIVDVSANVSVSLSVSDALNLLWWSLARQSGTTPEKLPTKFSTYLAFNAEYPTRIENEFTHLGVRYRIDQCLPKTIDEVIQQIPYTRSSFIDKAEFETFLTKQFKALLTDTRYMISTGDDLVQKAMHRVYSQLLLRKTHTFPPVAQATYSDWWLEHTDLSYLKAYYENDYQEYSHLTGLLIEVLFPITAEMAALVGVASYQAALYAALRKLFVQLCSYDIEFLDTTSYPNLYFEMPGLATHAEDLKTTVTLPLWNTDMLYLTSGNCQDELKSDHAFGVIMNSISDGTDTVEYPTGINMDSQSKTTSREYIRTGVQYIFTTVEEACRP